MGSLCLANIFQHQTACFYRAYTLVPLVVNMNISGYPSFPAQIRSSSLWNLHLTRPDGSRPIALSQCLKLLLQRMTRFFMGDIIIEWVFVVAGEVIQSIPSIADGAVSSVTLPQVPHSALHLLRCSMWHQLAAIFVIKYFAAFVESIVSKLHLVTSTEGSHFIVFFRC